MRLASARVTQACRCQILEDSAAPYAVVKHEVWTSMDYARSSRRLCQFHLRIVDEPQSISAMYQTRDQARTLLNHQSYKAVTSDASAWAMRWLE